MKIIKNKKDMNQLLKEINYQMKKLNKINLLIYCFKKNNKKKNQFNNKVNLQTLSNIF